MLQLCAARLTAALGLVLSAIFAASAEELLELSCANSEQCLQFERTGVHARCMQGQCSCTSVMDGAPVKCRPKDTKLSNIIAGPCPCTQPNSKCHEALDICYCIMEHRPSVDRRRCVPKIVGLYKPCEEDVQCQVTDPFTRCKSEEKICKCLPGYVEIEGICRALIGLHPHCSNDTECEDYGQNLVCALELEECICKEGFVAAPSQKQCIPGVNYHERCNDDSECQITLGTGGRCLQDVCGCDPLYYIYEVTPKAHPPKMACERKTERGQYCRVDEDCHERHRPEMDQLWECRRGECDCKYGPKAFVNGHCINRTSGTAAGWSKFNAHLWVWQVALATWQLV